MNESNEPQDAPKFPADLERALTRVRERELPAPDYQAVLDRIEADRIAGDPKLIAAARWMRGAAFAFFAMTAVLILINVLYGTPWGSWLDLAPGSRLEARTWARFAVGELADLADPMLVAVAGPALLVPAVALLFGARGMVSGRFAGAVMARAVAWSSLIVGVVITAEFGNPLYVLTGSAVAVCSGRALLLARERGLEDVTAQGTAFQPVAFRGPLVVALIMAWADALTLVFSGVLQFRWLIETLSWWYETGQWSHLWYAPFATLACGAVMVIAVAGLFRLRVWALLLNIVANVGIAALAVSDYLHLPATVILTVTNTAAIQLFLPVPVIAAAMGDKDAGQSWLHRAGHRAGYALVVLLMVVCVPAALVSAGRRGYLEAGGVSTAIRGAPKIPPSDVTSEPNYQIPRDGEGRRLHPADATGTLFLEIKHPVEFRSYMERKYLESEGRYQSLGWNFRVSFPHLAPGSTVRVATTNLPAARLRDTPAYNSRSDRYVRVDVQPRGYPSLADQEIRRGHFVVEYVEVDGTRHLDALVLDDHGGWFEVCPPGTCGPELDPKSLIEDPDFSWDAEYPPR